MAERPVFVPGKRRVSADVFMTEFPWSGGMALSQSQKNIDALHGAFNARFPERKVLEISSKSRQPLGVKLSAFNLPKFVPQLGRAVPLECVFQGSKVFAAGGPYAELYTAPDANPKAAKGDRRLRSSGVLRCFRFDGKTFAPVPTTAFYNWLYINALLENPELGQQLMEYDAFTDIAFNPGKSLNCQAEAAAVYVGLARRGVLEECRDYDRYLELIRL